MSRSLKLISSNVLVTPSVWLSAPNTALSQCKRCVQFTPTTVTVNHRLSHITMQSSCSLSQKLIDNRTVVRGVHAMWSSTQLLIASLSTTVVANIPLLCIGALLLPPRRLCNHARRLSVFLFVCLSVSLLATLLKNYSTDLRENFSTDVPVHKEDLIKF